jgi:hypothetical protein
MNIRPNSLGEFYGWLTDRGVPPNELEAAARAICKENGIDNVNEAIGRDLQVADRFIATNGDVQLRRLLGDVPNPNAPQPTVGGGRPMGAMGIHALANFDSTTKVMPKELVLGGAGGWFKDTWESMIENTANLTGVEATLEEVGGSWWRGYKFKLSVEGEPHDIARFEAWFNKAYDEWATD